ncbi:MAG TPA: hypothetical protein ENH94_11350 [Phycisphaerales bacterium]|nr:hypothetical protein [Phycisphaerales bacterium]
MDESDMQYNDTPIDICSGPSGGYEVFEQKAISRLIEKYPLADWPVGAIELERDIVMNQVEYEFKKATGKFFSAEKRDEWLFSLSEDEHRTLEYLADAPTVESHIKIAINLNRSRKTIGIKMKRLRELGLTERLGGKKSGDTITEKGRKYLQLKM